MKNYDKKIKSSYIEHLDANSLYVWVTSQKRPTNNFKCVKQKKLSKFNEYLIKKYDEDSNAGCFLEVDVEYPKRLFNLHKDLPFLPERKKVEKVEKLICSIEDKVKYVIHIRALKQALNYGLKLKEVQRVIQFIQKDWLKPYIDMNTELRKKAKNEFDKNFFKLMNNSVFGKIMESVRNHRDIKLVTLDKRRRRLVSEPNYHSHKSLSDHLIAIEMKKTRIKMTKPLYLGMSRLDISKYSCMNFGTIISTQSMETEQNFVTRILTALLFTLKPKIFFKIFQMMLKYGLIHLITIKMIKDPFQWVTIKKYPVFLKMN